MLVKWTLQLYKNSFEEYTNILNEFWLVQIKKINEKALIQRFDGTNPVYLCDFQKSFSFAFFTMS